MKNRDPHADAGLVERALRGERIAFEGLVDRHLRPVWGAAYALSGSSADADDLVQESFIAAWRDLSMLQDPDRFGAWLLSILRKKIADGQRLRERHERLRGRAVEAARRSPGFEPSEEEAMERREIERILKGEIATLPEDLRLPLVLYYLEGESTSAVAHRLGLTEAAVRKRLERARARLRSDLEHQLGAIMITLQPSHELRARIVAALPQPVPTPVPGPRRPASSACSPGTVWGVAGGGLLGLGLLTLLLLGGFDREPASEDEVIVADRSDEPEPSSAVASPAEPARSPARRVLSPASSAAPVGGSGGSPATSGEPDVAGTVTWQSNGAPAAGVLVRLKSRPELGIELLDTTDEEGRFDFDELAPGYYRLEPMSSEEVTVFGSHVEIDLVEDVPASCHLVVEPGFHISGVVVDGLTSEPLEGYQLWFARAEEPRRAWRGGPTDAEGRFRTESPVTAGEMSMLLREPHRNSAQALSSQQPPELWLPEPIYVEADVEDLVIEHPWRGRLAARVLDEAGQPIEGAKVTALKSNWRQEFHQDSIAEMAGRSRRTGEEGECILPCLPTGEPLVLMAQAPGRFHAIAEATLPVLEVEPAPIELQLGPSGRIAGRVLQPSGAPAVGAKVTASPMSWDLYPSPNPVLTDEDGAFVFDSDVTPGEMPGGCHLRSTWEELDSGSVTLPAEELQAAVIQLRSPLRTAGTIRRSDGSLYEGSGDIAGSLIGGGLQVSGRFKDGHFELQKLKPGEYTLELREDLAVSDETFRIRAGDENIELTWDGPAGRIAVEVVDSQTGLPLPNASVTATRGDGMNFTKTTDEEGRCRYEVDAADLQIAAIAPGKALATRVVEVRADRVGEVAARLELDEGVRLESRVVDSYDRPVPHLRVALATTYLVGKNIGRRFGIHATEVRADDDGRFTIEGLPANGGWLMITRDEDWKVEFVQVTPSMTEILFD